MKRVAALILACTVFFAGCDERESNPAPASPSNDANSGPVVLDAPIVDVNDQQEITEQAEITPAPNEKPREPDVVYVPTPQDVVDRMLELAKVQKSDLLYDLGCGDGRIVVTAARTYGCKAVGYDIDPQRIKESLENVANNNVGHLVTIEEKDIFTLDLSEANVITLYLLPSLNVKLIPQLDKLKPSSRIVSHDFRMRGVKPDKVEKLTSSKDNTQHKIFLWTTPLNKTKTGDPDPNVEGSPEEIPISIFDILNEPVLDPNETVSTPKNQW
ncbi:MAG: methyltransferase domain-containing protein [Planctomycetes bacterium]|nr:methyltransferase domain-containing protein [Planctomycetota bacterium]